MFCSCNIYYIVFNYCKNLFHLKVDLLSYEKVHISPAISVVKFVKSKHTKSNKQ